MLIINAAAGLALLIHTSSVVAVDLGSPLVGCSAVQCPSDKNSTSADCRIANHVKSDFIGLANFKPSISNNDFTWTETLQTYSNITQENKDHDSVYERSFYLGSPQGFDLAENAKSSGFGACAVFFIGAFDQAKFNGESVTTSTGTCDDALTGDCVNALLTRAKNTVGSVGNSSACEALHTQFGSGPPSECSRQASPGNMWGIAVQDLTGPQAPKPLTAAENSTSNCYPTLPKTNSLTPVAAFNASISNLISPLIDDIFRITPVLTVFIPTNGSGNATLQQIEAQLTCLKPIDETNAALANKNSTDNGKPSGAVQVTSKLGVLGAVVMVSSLILV